MSFAYETDAPISVSKLVAGRPPVLTNLSVAQIIQKHFGFSDVNEDKVESFPSFYDRNYYFQGKKESIQGSEFVLRLINPVATSCEQIESILDVMKHLHCQGFPCPQPIRHDKLLELSNAELTGASDESGSDLKYLVYVLTYINGEMFSCVDREFLTPNVFQEVGELLGKMDKELMDNFSSDSFVSKVCQDFDLLHFPKLCRYLDSIEDPSNRRNAERVIRDFEEFVSPRLSSFRRGIIHADVTGSNIILQHRDDCSAYYVAGFIDFNNSTMSCFVFELGTCLAHTMKASLDLTTTTDTVELAGPLIGGYHSMLPLQKEELDSLYYIVLARSVLVAINCMHVYRADPNTDRQFLPSVTKAWTLVDYMLSIPKETVLQLWNKCI